MLRNIRIVTEFVQVRYLKNPWIIHKMSKVPSVKLNNGKEMPIIGLGTWQSAPGDVYKAVKYAIDIGYRHIDCALLYGNETEVGRAIRESVSNGKVSREDLFITSKLWSTYHRREKVTEGCKKSLEDLGLSYLDLYLIHYPVSLKEGEDLHPEDENGVLLTVDMDITDTWRGMEECVDQGLTQSIGLSNFNSNQIQSILNMCRIKPSVLQIECHPYLNQKRLIDFCKQRDIAITAYSPLGSPGRSWRTSDEPSLLEDPKIISIAENHKKSVAQVLIRFHIERETVVIPKSITKERILSNFEVFDFQLTESEMRIMSNFEEHFRYCKFKGWEDGPNYPFNAEF